MEFLSGTASLNLSARVTKSSIYYCGYYAQHRSRAITPLPDYFT